MSVGCGGDDDISLVLSPERVAADGVSLVSVEVRIEFRGSVLPDGRELRVRSSVPSLFASVDDATDVVPGARASGADVLEVETNGGVARAYLLAPVDTSTPVTVSAEYTTVNGDVLRASAQVVVDPPPLVASARPGPTGCSDVDQVFDASREGFALDCQRRNVGAFVENRDTIEIECSIRTRTASGEELFHVPVTLVAEAGQWVEVPASPTSPRRFVHRVSWPLAGYPVDVPAHPAETGQGLVAVGGSPIPGAADTNPRDGLVTLLAVVRGSEGYYDGNGNGVYDVGEPFCDEGEPFLDVDDNGTFDAVRDRACCDDGNQVVDGPNGQWDGDKLIGRMVHVLWTGESSRSRISPNPATIPAQGVENFELTLLDANFNPPAAAGADDQIKLDVQPSASVGFTPDVSTSIPLVDSLGMELREGFPRHRFGASGVPVFEGFNTSALERQERFARRYPFTLRDLRSGSALCAPVSFTASATIRTTPAPDGEQTSFTQLQSVEQSGGSLEALSGTCPP